LGDLPRALRWYLWAIYGGTLLYMAYACQRLVAAGWDAAPSDLKYNLLLSAAVFTVLTYLGERTSLHVTGSISQSLSTAVHIAAILLFPAPYPMLIALAAVLFSQTVHTRTVIYKRVFNICHPMLTVGLTCVLCSLVARPTSVLHAGHFLYAICYLAFLLLTYYALDVAVLLGVISLLQGQAFWVVWWNTYRLTLLPELAASTVGILAAIAWLFDPTALGLVILPVAALRMAFRAVSQAEERAAVLRQRGEQLEVVIKAGQRLRLQHTQADLLHTMAEAALTVAGARLVTGYLRDAEEPARLERIVQVPAGADDSGPRYLAVADLAGGIREEDDDAGTRTWLVPLELENQGIAGVLRLVGLPADMIQNDQGALAILATQTTIALQNALMHERALAQASLDGLTGLLNHKSFQTHLATDVAQAVSTGLPLTLMMVDLDDFKSVNNAHGHQIGDAMLVAVAAALRENVRASDRAARYGGDEFAVILPDTEIEEGLVIAERVRAAIASTRLTASGMTIHIDASVGVASLPLHAETRQTLIGAADQAAYAAKQTGKSRVCRPEDGIVALNEDPVALAARLEYANLATVEALAAAVDAKDPYTRGHSQRVSAYAAILAQALGDRPADVARVRLAGLLHDVGKIGIPDAILTKPGRLTDEEFAIIQQHSVIGERMLSRVPFLHDILPAVRHHHERWDGKGYPDRVAGDAIPRDAAILMVADSFDAMTSSRTYRPALPQEEAHRRIREGRNTQFSPEVVAAFDAAVAEGSLVVLAVENGPSAIPQAPMLGDRDAQTFTLPALVR
jgi:diguanylate cyclase (GGDEF)-like protein/putative nucleotidyltransferase with HDIG domain